MLSNSQGIQQTDEPSPVTPPSSPVAPSSTDVSHSKGQSKSLFKKLSDVVGTEASSRHRYDKHY